VAGDRKRPARERARRWLEYVLARALVLSLSVLPLTWAYRVAEAVLGVFYRHSRYLARSRDSLAIALGGAVSDAEREVLLWRSIRYQAWFFVDLLLGPRLLRKARYRADVDLTPLVEALTAGQHADPDRGAVFVSGHLGSPDVGSLALAQAGWPHLIIARALDNPRIWAWLLAERKEYARPTVGRIRVLRDALERLKRGGVVGALIDQDAGPRGTFVPFFGRLASTQNGAAALAVSANAPLYVMFFLRTAPRAFGQRAVVRGPFFPDPAADRKDEIRRLTALATAEIEEVTRQHPEQAFWAHRRWKTRPPGEAAGACPESVGRQDLDPHDLVQ